MAMIIENCADVYHTILYNYYRQWVSISYNGIYPALSKLTQLIVLSMATSVILLYFPPSGLSYNPNTPAFYKMRPSVFLIRSTLFFLSLSFAPFLFIVKWHIIENNRYTDSRFVDFAQPTIKSLSSHVIFASRNKFQQTDYRFSLFYQWVLQE